MSNTPFVTWEGHLIIGVNKGKYAHNPAMWSTSARLAVKKPSVGSDEVAVKVSVRLPASLFQKPSLEVQISVPDAAVQPLVIGLDVQDNIRDIIQQNTGFEVKLVQANPPA